MREKSTQGITLDQIREQATTVKARALHAVESQARQAIETIQSEFAQLEESLTVLENEHDFAHTPTARALQEAGARGSTVELSTVVRQILTDLGVHTNPGAGPLELEPPEERTIMPPWMLRENTTSESTRWFEMKIHGRPQIFRFFKKHLPGQPAGERYTYLIRNLRGEAWRLSPVESDPRFGPGRPPKYVQSGSVELKGVEYRYSGTVSLNANRYTWRETPGSKTMLGVLFCEEKGLRYALIRDPSLDMDPDKMIPAQYREKK